MAFDKLIIWYSIYQCFIKVKRGLYKKGKLICDWVI